MYQAMLSDGDDDPSDSQKISPADRPSFFDDTASPIVSQRSVIQGHTQVYLGQSLQIYQKEEVF